MSKKHFIAIAAALHASKPPMFAVAEFSIVAEKQWHLTVLMIAETCQQFAPKFDRARFLRACGIAEGT